MRIVRSGKSWATSSRSVGSPNLDRAPGNTEVPVWPRKTRGSSISRDALSRSGTSGQSIVKMAGFSVRYGSTWTWTSVIPGTGRGTQVARKVFSPLPERSVRTREFSDRFLIVPIRSRTRRSVRVQQDVRAWVGIAEGEDRRRDGAAAWTVDAEADASGSRRVRAQGSLERPNHLLGIEGDLREDPLDELHLRIGRDVPALVRQDIQALVPSGHRELAVVPEEAHLLFRCNEEVPEVVFMLTDFSLEEHVDD